MNNQLITALPRAGSSVREVHVRVGATTLAVIA
jgi:hypothetical protein